ncbi:unnamed protein product [Darwinula stevensoni]|uniref:Cysteine protease n=1 Tax=Darwinula stevensoni TaxID=69355 RepID=A0A7R8X220_9CRUS|nr:unnamed protein product [Darwinula stevensoni]CAG0880982.1 unnamed protein product [Darwinula stevensoni]
MSGKRVPVEVGDGTRPRPMPSGPSEALRRLRDFHVGPPSEDSKRRDPTMPKHHHHFLRSNSTHFPSIAAKKKFQSVWNQVKYGFAGWNMRGSTNFVRNETLVLLGREYNPLNELDVHDADDSIVTEVRRSEMRKFKEDYQSRLWFTYRKDFPPIKDSIITTDCGWGCMLRTGQMILAQALIIHFLGRGWRWKYRETPQEGRLHRKIVQWFDDSAGSSTHRCPFSIHAMVHAGLDYGKQAGDWYGPSSVAHILREAVEAASQSEKLLEDLRVYVAQDCTVYLDDLILTCTTMKPSLSYPAEAVDALRPLQGASPPHAMIYPDLGLYLSSGDAFRNPRVPASDGLYPQLVRVEAEWKAVLILVPLRLGGDKLNPVYLPCLKRLLLTETCVGIIGGRPKHSLYFVGFQGDSLICLDPHFVQSYCDTTRADNLLDSYHCPTPRKISWSRMDPSCCLGFYCRTKDDLVDLMLTVKECILPNSDGSQGYPLFHFSKGQAVSMEPPHLVPEERILSLHRRFVNHLGEIEETENSEDFVFI